MYICLYIYMHLHIYSRTHSISHTPAHIHSHTHTCTYTHTHSLANTHSVNFPLRDGIDDNTHKSIFEPVMRRIMEQYQPGAIFLQCGADSLVGDRCVCVHVCVCVNMWHRVHMKKLSVSTFTPMHSHADWARSTCRLRGMADVWNLWSLSANPWWLSAVAGMLIHTRA